MLLMFSEIPEIGSIYSIMIPTWKDEEYAMFLVVPLWIILDTTKKLLQSPHKINYSKINLYCCIKLKVKCAFVICARLNMKYQLCAPFCVSASAVVSRVVPHPPPLFPQQAFSQVPVGPQGFARRGLYLYAIIIYISNKKQSLRTVYFLMFEKQERKIKVHLR